MQGCHSVSGRERVGSPLDVVPGTAVACDSCGHLGGSRAEASGRVPHCSPSAASPTAHARRRHATGGEEGRRLHGRADAPLVTGADGDYTDGQTHHS